MMGDSSITDVTDLTEDEEENKMEITRNPFDSHLYDKENYPKLDASIFQQSTTPTTPTSEEFRWSIGQIALMNPAELDLCPNQEYSILHDNKEDEIREQEEVNKYFQNVLLPSPWLDEKGEVLKRVTFSPHPPSLRYIPPSNDHSNSLDGSIEALVKKDNKDNKDEKVVMQRETSTMSDACCQTKISIPMNFDLEALLDKQLCSYAELSGEGKELMVSTLRRKLFEQEITDNSSSPALSQKSSCITSSPRRNGVSSADSTVRSMLSSPSVSPVQRRSILSSPSLSPAQRRSILSSPSLSPVQRRSMLNSPSLSPTQRRYAINSPSLSPVQRRSILNSPSLSPVQRRSILSSPSLSPPQRRSSSSSSVSVFSSSCDYSPKHASNIGMALHKKEMSLSSADVSPIRSCEKKIKHNSLYNYSFMPEVSFDIDESATDAVKESSRAIGFRSPDVSPIQYLKKLLKTSNSTFGFSAAMDSMEISGRQSIKESTARNIHAFSGIDMSSIGNGSNGKDGENKERTSALSNHEYAVKHENNVLVDEDSMQKKNIVEDDGPLDITELSQNVDEVDGELSGNYNYSYTDESSNRNENSSTDAETTMDSRNLIKADTPETVEQATINEVRNDYDNICENNDMDTPVLTIKMIEQQHISPSSLKGILKNSDSVTPTRPLAENSTRYNTICNSGKKRPIPELYTGMDAPEDKCDNNLPKPASINRSLSDEFNLSFHFKADRMKVGNRLDKCHDLVSMHANSALRRANSVVKQCERENDNKENKSPMDTSEGYDGEVDNGNTHVSFDDLKTSGRESSNVCVDSGIGSMEWSNELSKDDTNKNSPSTSETSKCETNKVSSYAKSTSVTPLMQLNKLNLHDRTPWSARRLHSDTSKYSHKPLNRYASTRSYTWLTKSRSGSMTPQSIVPRSRVQPRRFRSESSFKKIQSDKQYDGKSLLSAYKDLLPSPLK